MGAMAETGVDFGVLGPLQVTVGGDPLPLGTPKQRAVLVAAVFLAYPALFYVNAVDAYISHNLYSPDRHANAARSGARLGLPLRCRPLSDIVAEVLQAMERERHCRCEAGNQVTINRPAPNTNTALCRDAFDSRRFRGCAPTR
jgi:hypothetical protein